MAEQKQSSEKPKKGDFVEIEFIGRNLSNNEIFDTNVKEELKKLNPKAEPQPLLICIGQNMVVEGFDEALEGKEIGKKYTIKIEPAKAFGNRRSELVKLIPMRIFNEQKVYPQPGMTLALDNNLVKVISVSGGRVMVDFNSPLAGKDIEYEFTIKRIITDSREKITALQKFVFGQVFEFDLQEDGKTKKIIFKEAKLLPILNAFKDKFKEILGFDIEIFEEKENKEAKEDKKEEKSEEKKAI